MPVKETFKHILAELRGHAPFTTAGALLGVGFMLLFRDISQTAATRLFMVFHPAHVVLSAMVTASMFSLHRKAKNFILILIIGYIGSIGVASLSDCVMPYLGEKLFGLHIPSHSEMHEHSEKEKNEEGELEEHEHESDLHLGFIEEWYIVNPAAILGVLIAFFLPRTKLPHATHVLISTWASAAHILMNMQSSFTVSVASEIFIILFLAVWLPCCVSDIVFPLLFVKSDIELVNTCSCSSHKLHCHAHTHKHSDKCGYEGEANE